MVNLSNLKRKPPPRFLDPDNIITYSLAGLMGTMFFNHTNALASFLLFSALGGWIYKCVQKKQFIFEMDKVGFVILLMLASATISSIYSINVRYSFREFRGEIAKIVLLYFLIVTNIKSDKSIKIMLKFLLSGALVMAIIGVIGYFTTFTLYRERTVSLFANQSYTPLGFYLLLSSCLLFGFLIYERNIKKSVVILLMVIVYFSCILTTLTRSIWLGFFVATVITSSYYHKKLLHYMVPVVLFFFLVFPSNFTARFTTIFNYKGYIRPGGVLSNRIPFWKSALNIIKDYPVLGIGYGKRIFKRVYIKEGYILPEATEQVAPPDCHNLYLSMAVQGGIIGLSVFLSLIVMFFREANTIYKNLDDPFEKGLVFGSILAVFELLQLGITGNLFYDETGLYIIFLMATVMTFRHRPTDSSRKVNQLTNA